MQKTKSFFIVIFLMVFAAKLQAFSVTGSDSYVQKMDNLPSFKKLYISAGNVEVVLHQAKKSAVKLEGDKEVIDQLVIKVVQGELDITYKKKLPKNAKTGKVKVDITTSTLTSITARGSVDISGGENWRVGSLSFLLTGSGVVDMQLNAKNLLIELSGTTQLTLSGVAHSQHVAITGSGKYLGQDLKSDSSTVVLSGAGTATVFAKQALDATIYGSGDVEYKGSPKITSNIYGSGSIVKNSDF